MERKAGNLTDKYFKQSHLTTLIRGSKAGLHTILPVPNARWDWLDTTHTAVILPGSEPKTYRGKVTYQRWGRESCSSSAELIYKGVMAGSVDNFTGGGVNYLCLPEQPFYDFTVPGVDVYRAPVGATEYRFPGFSPLDHLHGTNAICAVCLADRSAIFVMPAQSTCPSDWTLEYSGYLMGSRSNRKRTEYICVDVNSEPRNYTRHLNVGSSQLFIAESHCLGETTGGLPCPPYINGAELPCAVCTT